MLIGVPGRGQRWVDTCWRLGGTKVFLGVKRGADWFELPVWGGVRGGPPPPSPFAHLWRDFL
jgi:hypothetical protein